MRLGGLEIEQKIVYEVCGIQSPRSSCSAMPGTRVGRKFSYGIKVRLILDIVCLTDRPTVDLSIDCECT
jgi:hypothetical protein